ncbi:PfkB family carbohydrate kinase [Leifsonia shinshuensis]|uniref:Fructokinase n=1 Tax=Leifsonia shinshuensis TaxID=150026 RepID=A0A853CYR9_9MICO|nr:PfkB family carbohydrate kinase [Leifsonia shinshuensis]NYJ25732.1 fructokinase [Leifsonia shinshuensis]
MATTTTATAPVLVAGEALIDVIRSADGTREHPGGSPANVALGLARLGVPTAFLTALGRDARGDTIAERLVRDGVDILPESWLLPATSSAVAAIQPDGSARYAFDIAWTLAERIELPAMRHVHVGSISAFLAPGADRIEHLVLTADADVTVSVDPNIRADLVGDPRAARDRFERLAARADLIKLSDEDALFLYPDRSDTETAAALAAHGAVVAVTRGAAGSLLVSGDAVAEVPPITVVVADTVGAGDSYMAALLAWFLTSGELRRRPRSAAELADAGAFAARAAAITVSRAGAEPPRTAELPQA